MLDETKSDEIGKTDLFRFLFMFREGYRVFPTHVTRAVEMVKVARGD